MSEAAPVEQATSSPASEQAPSPPAENSDSQKPNPAAEAPKGFVPNAALSAERRKARQAAEQAQHLQQQLAQTQADLAAMRVQREQASPQPNTAVEAARKKLRAQVGNDEAGDKAMEMFDAYGEVIRAESSGLSQEQVDQMITEKAAAIVRQELGAHTQQERAVMNVAQRLNTWVDKGSLTPAQAVEMRQKFDEIAADAPHVLTPTNAHAVLSNLFTDALDAGEVAAFTPKSPRPPVSPSPTGDGPPAPPQDAPEVMDPSTHMMQALRGQTPEAIRRIREQSIARHNAATGGV